jgi:outer membrane protein assembly factor BamA
LAGLDYRDLEWWPSRGGYGEGRVNFVFGTRKFVRSQAGLRGYFPLHSYFSSRMPHRPPVLAVQISAATSTTSTPSFAHYYFGFEQGFRGYRNVRSESAGYIVGDAELRFPITGESTYNVPFIGRWGRHWPLGLAGVVFIQRGELQLDNTRTPLLGYGGGVYLRVPYVQLVELALSENRDSEHEFTMRLGVGF